jgi:phosphoesterase, MJ0936 family
MKKIGIISDTHGYLHPETFSFFEKCDEIWHAGDIGNSDVLDQLSIIAPVKAVYGNCDDWDIRKQTSECLVFPCEEHKVVMMHIVGYPGKYDFRTIDVIKQEQPTILVAGHSHILKVMHDPKNQLFFINPGAAGKQGIHTRVTFLRFDISGKELSNMEIYDEPRSPRHV